MVTWCYFDIPNLTRVSLPDAFKHVSQKYVSSTYVCNGYEV